MNVNLIWSIVLGLIGIVGLLLAGSKRKSGWLLGVCAQVLWFIFALVSRQYGFILSSVVYGVVYSRNYYKWRKTDRLAKSTSVGDISASRKPVKED